MKKKLIISSVVFIILSFFVALLFLPVFFVVPSIEDMIRDAGLEVPATTQFIFEVTSAITQNWCFVLPFAFVILLGLSLLIGLFLSRLEKKKLITVSVAVAVTLFFILCVFFGVYALLIIPLYSISSAIS